VEYDRGVPGTVQTPERHRQTLSVRARPEAVAEARRWASDVADGLLDDRQHSDLKLIVSEVVTNALRHGAPPGEEIQLVVTPKEAFLCVQVTDPGPGLAPRPRATAPEENGGYGLFLIEQLTRRWGLTRENRSTRVWFELDYATPA
jgi:anti-sigma regulatory factor (Ser/Thr protein kinase)